MSRPLVDPASVSAVTSAALTVVLTLVIINAVRQEWDWVGVGLGVAAALVIILALLPPVKGRKDR